VAFYPQHVEQIKTKLHLVLLWKKLYNMPYGNDTIKFIYITLTTWQTIMMCYQGVPTFLPIALWRLASTIHKGRLEYLSPSH